MTIDYTTHLICAPELPGPAQVLLFHVKPGQQVEADTLLLTLLLADQEWPVVAPDAGQIASLMVEYGDFVTTGDLLLQMEIIEKPTGTTWLIEPEPTLSEAHAPEVPSAIPVQAASHAFLVEPAAAALAAKLGLDLSRLSTGETIDEDAVLEFARQELNKLAKLRQLLS